MGALGGGVQKEAILAAVGALGGGVQREAIPAAVGALGGGVQREAIPAAVGALDGGVQREALPATVGQWAAESRERRAMEKRWVWGSVVEPLPCICYLSFLDPLVCVCFFFNTLKNYFAFGLTAASKHDVFII